MLQLVLAFLLLLMEFVGQEQQRDRLLVRMEYLKSVLKQEAGFFDTQEQGSSTTFQVVSTISNYANSIQAVICEKRNSPYSFCSCSCRSVLGALPNLSSITEATVACARIFEMIDRVRAIDTEDKTGKALSYVRGDIEFKDIYFCYPSRPDTPVLQGLNLRVPAGKTVGLVGGSGCGKSTTISLLQRFYDPVEGDVLLEWLRSQMGLVSQEPVLFATSIKENILFGQEGGSIEDVISAVKAANAHDFITKLPEGYETQVGQFGFQISDGQKQRIAIARALIRDPKILLLDEATSALDAQSERVIQEAIDKATVGRTTIIIAHHLSTIRIANLITVFNAGKVIESGSHNELIQMNGEYYQSVQLQKMAMQNETSNDFNRQMEARNLYRMTAAPSPYGPDADSFEDNIDESSYYSQSQWRFLRHCCSQFHLQHSPTLQFCGYGRKIDQKANASDDRGAASGVWQLLCQEYVDESMAGKAQKAQKEGSQLASEAVINHRTITAFSSQKRVSGLFKATLRGPKEESLRHSWLSEAGSSTNDLSKGSSAVRSVFAILDRNTEIDPETTWGRDIKKDIRGRVELKNVFFAYPARPDQLIFKGLNLRIEAGRTVALVGQSGCGKSTIIGLIERFYDPSKGSVFIVEQDIKNYNLRKLRSHIALVSQEPTLFAGTISENIAYGKENARESEIKKAAFLANAHEFISGMNDGYDTYCGERGVQLSGGQKQRIALARTILKNPAILPVSESLVQEALEKMMVGRTSIVVAHRLSTTQKADMLSRMEKLQNNELLSLGRGGAYYSLIKLQGDSSPYR
ncbi:hypothetical protein Ddye_027292 [Dipteronia dyeriana]|uniref:ABC transporter domain-containing protein n=1 Tax=Dipteronia dyeriana TaxID=168575 RepID=A0AAD9WR93_9ROSI|nr:hypothetical protein Ddye_027292 [Dipteronia dyeriana]